MNEVGDFGFCLTEARDISSFKGGGRAYVAYPRTVEELKTVLAACDATILGGGSNILVADGVAKTPFVSLKRFDDIEFDGCTAFAGAGVRIATLARAAAQRNLGGLEFLAGVPASVGGAVRMNAGAFGCNVGGLTRLVRALDGDYAAKDIPFAYRQGFKGVAIGVELQLVSKPKSEIEALTREYLLKRAAKQPRLPSLGSVFKNGVESAGKLIEKCGLKGVKEGGAQISPMHANFIVNLGGASANDYLTLAKLCEDTVLKMTGIRLEREFVYVE